MNAKEIIHLAGSKARQLLENKPCQSYEAETVAIATDHGLYEIASGGVLLFSNSNGTHEFSTT